MLRLLASPISSWPPEMRVSFEFLPVCVCVRVCVWMCFWVGGMYAKVKSSKLNFLPFSDPPSAPSGIVFIFLWAICTLSAFSTFCSCCSGYFSTFLFTFILRLSPGSYYICMYTCAWVRNLDSGIWKGSWNLALDWGHLLFIALQIKVEPHKTCKIIYSNKY